MKIKNKKFEFVIISLYLIILLALYVGAAKITISGKSAINYIPNVTVDFTRDTDLRVPLEFQIIGPLTLSLSNDDFDYYKYKINDDSSYSETYVGSGRIGEGCTNCIYANVWRFELLSFSSGYYHLFMKTSDDSGNIMEDIYGTEPYYFYVDLDAPSIDNPMINSQPYTGTLIEVGVGEDIYVEVEINDDADGIPETEVANATIEISGMPCEYLNGPDQDGTYTKTISGLGLGTYNIEIVATDDLSNENVATVDLVIVCVDDDGDGAYLDVGGCTPIDCDDNDPIRYPGADDICHDGIDQDCSGQDALCNCVDNDGDGFYGYDEITCWYGNDCDDTNSDICPGADEICSDGIDQDCDGQDLVCPACFTNNDRDAYCADNPDDPDYDCDDNDPHVYPGAAEICEDGKDNDCVGGDAECTCEIRGLMDNDGDGYCLDDEEEPMDCDDTNPDINPAATEICNNQYDEDCQNGALICEDDNVCTDNICGDEQCIFENNNMECDDNLFCTVNDQCSGGICDGIPRDCDDGRACTVDSCDEDTKSCVHNTNSCECDSDKDCEDGDVCTDNTCSGGYCSAPTYNSAQCNDGIACAVNDQCSYGVCQGTQKDCDDSDSCTIDSCDSYTGECIYEFICECSSDYQCSDGDICTDDYCMAGECIHLNNNAPCDDNSECTVNDQCSDGQCLGTQISCDDNVMCTIDSCEPDTGCTYDPINCECYSDYECEDGNICTDNTCDLGTNQCNTALYNNEPCNDNKYCTLNDVCTEGQCMGTGITCNDQDDCTSDECNEDTDTCTYEYTCPCIIDEDCDDWDVCTDDACLNGYCEYTYNTVQCDDKEWCTVSDTCNEGQCIGTARSCDDGRSCTQDSCSEDTDSCTYTTTNCQCGSDAECEDFNPCTDNTCNLVEEICNAPTNNDALCEDGLFCIENDQCNEGICYGISKDCDDGLDCTLDSCSEDLDMCIYDYICPCSTDVDCDDSNPCTDESCTDGTCRYTKHSDCDNDNICDEFDSDDDNDGVPDDYDGEICTQQGCDIDPNSGIHLDSDNDGICDSLDLCGGTLSGCPANEQGCPEECDDEVNPACVGDPGCLCTTCGSCFNVYGYRCSVEECSACGNCYLDIVEEQRDQCLSCDAITSCEDYDFQENCLDNPCIEGFECGWTVNKCVTLDTFSPPPPVIEDLPSRVNTEYITISGTAEEDAMVYVYVNDMDSWVGFSRIEEGRFVVENIQLKQGENNITARAEDTSGNIGNMSERRVVIYVPNGPGLETIEPGDGEIKSSVDSIAIVFELYLDTPIDFAYSDIVLKNENEDTIPGSLENNGYNEIDFIPTMGLEDGIYDVVVTVVDILGNQEQYDATFSLVSKAPIINLELPIDGDVLTSRSIEFIGSIESKVSTVDIIRSTLTLNGNEYELDLIGNFFSLFVAVEEDGIYNFTIQSENELHFVALEKGQITVDTIGPGGCITIGGITQCFGEGPSGIMGSAECGNNECEYGEKCIDDCIISVSNYDLLGISVFTDNYLTHLFGLLGTDLQDQMLPSLIYSAIYSRGGKYFTVAVSLFELDQEAYELLSNAVNSLNPTLEIVNSNKVCRTTSSIFWLSNNKLIEIDTYTELSDCWDLVGAYLAKYPSTII